MTGPSSTRPTCGDVWRPVKYPGRRTTSHSSILPSDKWCDIFTTGRVDGTGVVSRPWSRSQGRSWDRKLRSWSRSPSSGSWCWSPTLGLGSLLADLGVVHPVLILNLKLHRRKLIHATITRYLKLTDQTANRREDSTRIGNHRQFISGAKPIAEIT